MATYNAQIAVQVKGLNTLKNLEDRVGQLQKNFTKLNAAAARVSAPFQGHIKAIKELNALLAKTERLMAPIAKQRVGGGGGGSRKTGVDPKVLREQQDLMLRQVRLLQQRASLLDDNAQMMRKLRDATNSIVTASELHHKYPQH